jgi:hypothetical protein
MKSRSLLTRNSIPSSGITTFGPLIINAFGYDQFTTILFNLRFGALQFIAVIASGMISTSIKMRGPVIIGLSIPAIVGCVMLLRVDRSDTGLLLFGYYLVICVSPVNRAIADQSP